MFSSLLCHTRVCKLSIQKSLLISPRAKENPSQPHKANVRVNKQGATARHRVGRAQRRVIDIQNAKRQAKAEASKRKMTMTRQRSCSSASEPRQSKEELWAGCLERPVGDDAVVQMIGLESSRHIVYARVIRTPNGGGEGKEEEEEEKDGPPKVTVMAAVQAMVDEEFDHLIHDVLEKKKRLRTDAHPPAAELFRLGSVWLINETAYTKGEDTHAHRLHLDDGEKVPDWTDMTLRVHYMPERHHMAHEVDWTKYCRGLLVGGNVEVTVGGEKPHVPMKGLPDGTDGAVVYEDENMGYAVLNKPGGLPGHGCKSNNTENVCVLFHEALKELWPKSHRKIHVTLPQHVDSEVEGLTLVSTRREFADYCAKHLTVQAKGMAKIGEETKKYRCLVCVKDPADMDKIQHFQEVGAVLTHYFDPKSPHPRKKFVRNHPSSVDHRWTETKMRISSVGSGAGERGLRAASVTSQYADANEPDVTLAHRLWKPEPNSNPADNLGVQYVMEIEVEDLSDKPHQLRGQLAQLGTPIVGDFLYGGGICTTGAHRHTWRRMALQCSMLAFPEPKWEEGGEQGDGGKMVPSDKKCYFRLSDAWWTPYLEEYSKSV